MFTWVDKSSGWWGEEGMRWDDGNNTLILYKILCKSHFLARALHFGHNALSHSNLTYLHSWKVSRPLLYNIFESAAVKNCFERRLFVYCKSYTRSLIKLPQPALNNIKWATRKRCFPAPTSASYKEHKEEVIALDLKH